MGETKIEEEKKEDGRVRRGEWRGRRRGKYRRRREKSRME